MASYIDQDDIENVYGSDNVVQWSNLTGANTVNSTRVTAAIDWAEAFVENRFRQSRYTVPFVAVGTYDKMLIDWCAAYAGYWLYRSRQTRRRTGENQDQTKPQPVMDAESQINDVLAGAMDLDLELEGEPSPETPGVVT